MIKRKEITRQMLSAYGVHACLKHGAAIVLERIARGGGDTAWYFCKSEDDLSYINDNFRGGSVVSFYFDDRIKVSTMRDLPKDEIDKIVDRSGDCVVGAIGLNSIDIDVTLVATSKSLPGDFDGLSPETLFIYGEYPSRDYDGKAAITFILPDDDGVFRPHPH